MLEWIQFIVGAALILAGLVIFALSVIGVYRFKYVLNRMHAAAVGDTLGLFCILIGLILFHGWSLSAAKTLLILVFLWLTSPVASHLIAEMEIWTISDIHSECREERR